VNKISTSGKKQRHAFGVTAYLPVDDIGGNAMPLPLFCARAADGRVNVTDVLREHVSRRATHGKLSRHAFSVRSVFAQNYQKLCAPSLE